MGKLDGKIALIIDGSDGIGFTIAQQFVSEGAYVFITGRSKEALDAAVKKIDDKHITAIRANSAELDDIDNIINIMQKEKEKLNILVANADMFGLGPLGSITEKSFDIILTLTFEVYFYVTKAAVRSFARC
ncbi:unnamed protein product [Rotaria sordida]|uniref:Uncharacterized protein n=1 Tax=Rotaria sordida TaxID=392033 RepID=A0A819PPK4_9BILA|nr:unnamed protein product [Rotaria sordida]